MKNKTKLHRPTRQTRRFTNITPAPIGTPQTAADHRHDLLVLCYYPGMPARPDHPVAA